MSRCALCPGTHKCVPPSGPVDCDNCFIGEAPNRDDERNEMPFSGKTGQEVNDGYMPLAGLRRSEQYVSNAISCLPDTSGNRLETDNEAHIRLLTECSEHHLFPHLRRQKPDLIIPMGALANYVIDPAINLELQHGIPLETKWGTTFPMFHPAGGIHEPKKMLIIRTDWHRLGKYLKGTLRLPRDRHSVPDYQECKDYNDLEEIDPNIDMACDTEYSKSLGPYCLTYSQRAGSARLIRATRKDLLERFQVKIKGWKSRIFWHNWVYDVKVTTEMGLKFPDHVIRDTMVRAFHLGNLPQGLKALCYRELGMTMQDFDDLVVPYSRPHVIDYYRHAFNQPWIKPEPEEVRDKDGGVKIYQAQSMSTKFKRFFTDLNKKPDKDVFKAWKNWAAQHAEIEEMCGEWPGKDIAHVPFDKVLHYACRDADGTIRLVPILERMKSNVRRTTQENWKDYKRSSSTLSLVG